MKRYVVTEIHFQISLYAILMHVNIMTRSRALAC